MKTFNDWLYALPDKEQISLVADNKLEDLEMLYNAGMKVGYNQAVIDFESEVIE